MSESNDVSLRDRITRVINTPCGTGISAVALIVIGAIGTVLAVLKHTFPKDTVANSVMGIIDSIFSGIYLF